MKVWPIAIAVVSTVLLIGCAAETQPGFSERAYHDRLLSWGSPAMKYVRRLIAQR